MIEIEGLSQLNVNIEKILNEMGYMSEKAIADVAMDLGSKASNAAPVDSGDLRGDLANPRKEGQYQWKVGSGLPYTRRQHEGIHFRHPKGGGPKFLERPLRENEARYIKYIAEQTKKALGR